MSARLTVVIPTRRRPDTLVAALQSVLRQSALEQIDHIIVSENSDDDGSAEVVRALAHPGLVHIRQQPECGPQSHLLRLIERAESPFIAILHDDDWWLPGHLANALRLLVAHPEASAAAAGYAHVEAPNSPRAHNLGFSPVLHIGLGRPDALMPWLVDARVMTAVCRVHAPMHFSSLVVRRAAALASAAGLADTVWYSADRIWLPHLAAQGPVVYDPLPSLCVRWHSGNWAAAQASAHREAEFQRGSALIAEQAQRSGYDLEAFWRERLVLLSEAERRATAPLFARAYPDAARVGMVGVLPRATSRERLKAWTRGVLRRLLPA